MKHDQVNYNQINMREADDEGYGQRHETHEQHQLKKCPKVLNTCKRA